MLLIGYHVMPFNMNDPVKTEIWHQENDKIMKILGVKCLKPCHPPSLRATAGQARQGRRWQG
jgi:hypothetical protein